MLESKYLQKFKKLEGVKFDLYSDRILVEDLRFEKVTKSGIIAHVDAKSYKDHYEEEAAHFAMVLLVGKGYYDEETGKDIPMDIKQGDILMIPPFSVRWLSELGPFTDYKQDKIGLTTEKEIHFNFGPLENFNKFFNMLNE